MVKFMRCQGQRFYYAKKELRKIEIIKKTSTHNTSAYANRPIKYIVIHYTAGTSSVKGVARNVAAMFANPASRAASADFIVDDAEIVQYNPDIRNRYCYSVGGMKYSVKYTSQSGILYGICKNYNSVSIEMCSSKVNKKSLSTDDRDWSISNAVINNTVELTKYLMKTYNVPIDRVVMHHTVTGKMCPLPFCQNEACLAKWNAFKARLTGASPITNNNSSGETTVNYYCRVTDSTGLNCRKGIGTGFDVVKAYPVNAVLKVSKESYGWGFVDGIGWVNLSYTRKLTDNEVKNNTGKDVELMDMKQFLAEMNEETALMIYNKAINALAKQDVSSDLANEGHWDRAKAKNITDGSAPRKPMTREQAITILGRAGLI